MLSGWQLCLIFISILHAHIPHKELQIYQDIATFDPFQLTLHTYTEI